jgi:3-oxoacyl-[acyl-carrier protein] reductase
MSIEGSIAVVTGASRGIGQAILRTLGAKGAVMMGTATTELGAEGITEDLRAHNCKGRGLKLDVAEPATIAAVVKTIQDEFGTITILVNNAGVARDNLLMRMKAIEWEEIININLTSLYHLTKACLRGMMKARYGRIINIASVVGQMGNPGQSNYAAAKAGMIGFTKSLARELGARDITVNAVAPGFIDTDMTQTLPEQQREALVKQIPLNRLGQTSDVANAVAFLASSEAAYITGETLNVNGGMYMP